MGKTEEIIDIFCVFERNKVFNLRLLQLISFDKIIKMENRLEMRGNIYNKSFRSHQKKKSI